MSKQPADPKDLRLLQSALAGSANEYRVLRGTFAFDFAPAPGSQGADEIATQATLCPSYSLTPIDDCYSIASLRLIAAADHMDGLARLLTDPPQIFSTAPVCRAALETCALAWWLLDPATDARGRMLRGMTETINSLVESRRVPALEAVSSSLLAVRQARLTDEGISCTLNRLGSVQEIGGLKPPGYTQAVREQGYESFYRVLTAVAHGVFYGLAWLTQSVQQPTSAGSGLLNPIADQDQVIACTAAVISSFLDATDRHAKLFGWRRVEWDSWRTETRRAVGRLLRKLG